MNQTGQTAENAESLSDWAKTPVASQIRYKPSGIYFARVRIRGKLFRHKLKPAGFGGGLKSEPPKAKNGQMNWQCRSENARRRLTSPPKSCRQTDWDNRHYPSRSPSFACSHICRAGSGHSYLCGLTLPRCLLFWTGRWQVTPDSCSSCYLITCAALSARGRARTC